MCPPIGFFEDDPSTPEDQMHVVATMQGGAHYQFGIDFDWPSLSDVLSGGVLPEIKAGFDVYAGAEAHLNLDGMATRSYSRTDTLAHAYLGSFPIGPLLFFVTDQPFTTIDNPCLTFKPSGIAVEKLGVSLVPDIADANDISPPVQKVTP